MTSLYEINCPGCSKVLCVKQDGYDIHVFHCPNCNTVIAVEKADTNFPTVIYSQYTPRYS